MHRLAFGITVACDCLTIYVSPLGAQEVRLPSSPNRAVAAGKLFPQITEGVYNGQGQLVMDCQIGCRWPDGDRPRVVRPSAPSGKGKRWNFNQTPYTEKPLVNYRFDEKFAGLQVNITVEIFDPANPWEVSETYQEVLQLGGVPRNLPAWFHVPQNRLAYDFDEGTWFPSGWQLPEGNSPAGKGPRNTTRRTATDVTRCWTSASPRSPRTPCRSEDTCRTGNTNAACLATPNGWTCAKAAI